jgi:hypothetical protein
MIERFCKELDRALSHRLNPHLGISVSSNEDDRDIAFLIFQPCLQFQTRHLRHKNVSYQARSPSMQTGFELGSVPKGAVSSGIGFVVLRSYPIRKISESRGRTFRDPRGTLVAHP